MGILLPKLRFNCFKPGNSNFKECTKGLIAIWQFTKRLGLIKFEGLAILLGPARGRLHIKYNVNIVKIYTLSYLGQESHECQS